MKQYLLFPPGFSNEAQLLFCAVGVWKDSHGFERIQELLRYNLDWSYIAAIAEQNKVSQILHRSLEKAEVNSVPTEFLRSLRENWQFTRQINMVKTLELMRILKLFESHGIDAAPYKGPYLTSLIYEDLGLRPCADLDILVRRRDAVRAKGILLSDAYRFARELDHQEELVFLEKDNEYTFRHKSIPEIVVEIHWGLLSPGIGKASEIDFVWECARESRLNSIKIHVFPPETMFLIILLHAGVKHQWAQLRWISDVARFIRAHPYMDWEEILHHTKRTGSEAWTFLGLHLASKLLGVVIPDKVSREIERERIIHSLAGLVVGRLLRVGCQWPGYSEWLGYVKQYESYENGNSLWSYVRYLRAVMMPEYADHMFSVSLPRQLSFLRYFRKPIRHLAKNNTRLFERVR